MQVCDRPMSQVEKGHKVTGKESQTYSMSLQKAESGPVGHRQPLSFPMKTEHPGSHYEAFRQCRHLSMGS